MSNSKKFKNVFLKNKNTLFKGIQLLHDKCSQGLKS